MGVRRIVTGEVDGRSGIVSDSESTTTWCDEIWMTTAEQPFGLDPGAAQQPLEPAEGNSHFRIVTLPPEAIIREAMRAAAGTIEAVDADGFHKTDSIVYLIVMDGPVELMLDEGSVLLEPGDCVVQRGTNHAWRNHGDKPIRLVCVMIGRS